MQSKVVDRRQFLHKTALVAAASAFGAPLLSCGDSELVIPCLGPAAAPDTVPGMTYIRASEIGCALDCDLQNGHNKYTGGAATDDGPRINTAMAGATADNPITLIIDGSALISGLFLPAGGHWAIAGLGCGTGFFVKKGTNNDGIHNGPSYAAIPSDPGPPAPPRGRNVSLNNFTLNGNQGDGHSGNSTTGKHQGTSTTWYFGINLMNLDNITIENVVVVNTPAYHIRLSNVGNVGISGCVMQSKGDNTDGIHIDGLANDISIANCDFTTGDDAIALNAPEGYSGNISRVSVSHCTFKSLSVMRLYTTSGGGRPKFNIDTVNVSDCSGTLSVAAFLIGISNQSNPNSVDALAIANCTLTAPVLLGVLENFGSIALSKVTFIPVQSGDAWGKDQRNHTSAILRSSPVSVSQRYVGSSLSIEDCTIYRNSDITVNTVLLDNGTAIGSLAVNGFTVQDAGSYSRVSELVNIQSGSVDQLVIDSLNNSNINALLSSGGFTSVRSVSGTGVLATGWKFPDSAMASGVPYISATTGVASVKIGGVIVPYPQR